MDFRIEAPNLFWRYRQGDAFRRYVHKRLPLIIPVVVVFLAISLATTTGAVVYIGGRHSFVVLLGLVVAPFFLLGSLSVQLFVFFSWLERRAIDGLTGRRPRTPQERLAAVPWGAAALFVAVPFIALALLTLKVATLLLALGVLAPIAYSALDR